MTVPVSKALYGAFVEVEQVQTHRVMHIDVPSTEQGFEIMKSCFSVGEKVIAPRLPKLLGHEFQILMQRPRG